VFKLRKSSNTHICYETITYCSRPEEFRPATPIEITYYKYIAKECDTEYISCSLKTANYEEFLLKNADGVERLKISSSGHVKISTANKILPIIPDTYWVIIDNSSEGKVFKEWFSKKHNIGASYNRKYYGESFYKWESAYTIAPYPKRPIYTPKEFINKFLNHLNTNNNESNNNDLQGTVESINNSERSSRLNLPCGRREGSRGCRYKGKLAKSNKPIEGIRSTPQLGRVISY
jgi:hypothetical protein